MTGQEIAYVFYAGIALGLLIGVVIHVLAHKVSGK